MFGSAPRGSAPKRRGSGAWQLLLAGLACAAFCLGAPTVGHAQGAGTDRWETLQSGDCRLHYHAQVADIADDVLQMCVQALEVLIPRIGNAPQGVIELVLVDEVDAANGSATVIPRRLVFLQGMPPESGSVLGHYDNWMWNLVVHELVHILQIEIMGGLARVLNVPFGRFVAPSQVLPRWMLEGLATYLESLHSGRGRPYSPYFETWLRVGAIGNRLPTVDALSGAPLQWPQATGWYLYGGFFFRWLAERYGWEGVQHYFLTYPRRAIPLGLSIISRRSFGYSIDELWAQWAADAQGRAQALGVVQQARGLTPFDAVTDGGHNSREVAVDPVSGRVAWVRDDATDAAVLEVLEADGSVRRIAIPGSGEIAWVPGQDRLVLSQIRALQDGYVTRDLYDVHLSDGSLEERTHGARAREPSVSVDGQTMVWVAPAAGRTNLWVEGQDGQSRLLAEAPRWGQFARPAISPDGRWVASSLQAPGLGRAIVLVDLATGALQRVTDDPFENQDPTWVDASTLVYGSDRGGTCELWTLAIDPAAGLPIGPPHQLTRGWGGYFRPAVRVDGENWEVFASRLGPDGFDIVRMTLRRPADGSSVAADPARMVRTLSSPALETASGVVARRYAAGRFLAPLTWFPTVQFVDGDIPVGVLLVATDPVGLHAWSAALNWSTRDEEPFGFLDYRTRVLPVQLGVFASRNVATRDRGFRIEGADVPFLQENWLVSASTAYLFPAPEGTHSVGVSYAVQWSDWVDEPTVEVAPEQRLPVLPEFIRRNSVGASWGWSSVRGATLAPEGARQGVSVGLGARAGGPAIGSEVSNAELSWNVRGFVPLGRGTRQVLALRTSGGLGSAAGIGRGLYAMGGPGPQDLVKALSEQLPAGAGNVRGYAPGVRVGDRFWLHGVEYRFPLWNPDWGISTLPVFFGGLTGALFVDAGDAWSGRLIPQDALLGAGGEVRLNATFGYFLGASFRLGLARGLTADGIWNSYFLYGYPF